MRMVRRIAVGGEMLKFLCLPILVCSQLTSLSNVIGDGMVLQREPRNAILWGRSGEDPGSFRVRLGGEEIGLARQYVEKTTKQDHDKAAATFIYTWTLHLAPRPAGGPFELVIESEHLGSVTVSDVLFGDVFLCLGQSNMEMKMVEDMDWQVEKAANYPMIRFMTANIGELKTNGDITPPNSIDVHVYNPWERISPASVGSSSAVCYYFAKQVHERLGIPVGMSIASVAGQRVSEFMSAAAMEDCLSHGESAYDGKHKRGLDVLLRQGVSAVLWYQGESDADAPDRYTCLMTALISSWREQLLSESTFRQVHPFLLVELAPWILGEGFELIRRVQRKLSESIQAVAISTSLDLGGLVQSHLGSVHPRFKRLVGERLFDAGLSLLYPHLAEPQEQPLIVSRLQLSVMKASKAASLPLHAGAVYDTKWVMGSREEAESTGVMTWVVNISVGGEVLLEQRDTTECWECCKLGPIEILGVFNTSQARQHDEFDIVRGLSQYAVGPGWIAYARDMDPSWNGHRVRYGFQAYPQCLLYAKGASLPVVPLELEIQGPPEPLPDDVGIQVRWDRSCTRSDAGGEDGCCSMFETVAEDLIPVITARPRENEVPAKVGGRQVAGEQKNSGEPLEAIITWGGVPVPTSEMSALDWLHCIIEAEEERVIANAEAQARLRVAIERSKQLHSHLKAREQEILRQMSDLAAAMPSSMRGEVRTADQEGDATCAASHGGHGAVLKGNAGEPPWPGSSTKQKQDQDDVMVKQVAKRTRLSMKKRKFLKMRQERETTGSEERLLEGEGQEDQVEEDEQLENATGSEDPQQPTPPAQRLHAHQGPHSSAAAPRPRPKGAGHFLHGLRMVGSPEQRMGSDKLDMAYAKLRTMLSRVKKVVSREECETMMKPFISLQELQELNHKIQMTYGQFFDLAVAEGAVEAVAADGSSCGGLKVPEVEDALQGGLAPVAPFTTQAFDVLLSFKANVQRILNKARAANLYLVGNDVLYLRVLSAPILRDQARAFLLGRERVWDNKKMIKPSPSGEYKLKIFNVRVGSHSIRVQYAIKGLSPEAKDDADPNLYVDYWGKPSRPLNFTIARGGKVSLILDFDDDLYEDAQRRQQKGIACEKTGHVLGVEEDEDETSQEEVASNKEKKPIVRWWEYKDLPGGNLGERGDAKSAGDFLKWIVIKCIVYGNSNQELSVEDLAHMYCPDDRNRFFEAPRTFKKYRHESVEAFIRVFERTEYKGLRYIPGCPQGGVAKIGCTSQWHMGCFQEFKRKLLRSNMTQYAGEELDNLEDLRSPVLGSRSLLEIENLERERKIREEMEADIALSAVSQAAPETSLDDKDREASMNVQGGSQAKRGVARVDIELEAQKTEWVRERGAQTSQTLSRESKALKEKIEFQLREAALSKQAKAKAVALVKSAEEAAETELQKLEWAQERESKKLNVKSAKKAPAVKQPQVSKIHMSLDDVVKKAKIYMSLDDVVKDDLAKAAVDREAMEALKVKQREIQVEDMIDMSLDDIVAKETAEREAREWELKDDLVKEAEDWEAWTNLPEKDFPSTAPFVLTKGLLSKSTRSAIQAAKQARIGREVMGSNGQYWFQKGYVFAATHKTFAECVGKNLFGGPSSTWGFVKKISVGDTALFLYNVSTATLHGVYVATVPPQYSCESSAWASQFTDYSGQCPYPSQVQVRHVSVLRPIPLHVYTTILAEQVHTQALPSSRSTSSGQTKIHSMELTADEVAAVIKAMVEGE